MALLYDSFGIRRVQLEVSLWPALDGFVTGELGRLFGALNGEDIFTESEIRPSTGARFEGEHWVYDLMTRSLLLECRGFETPERMREQIRKMLEDTRAFFDERRQPAFYTDEVRVIGIVPEDGERHIGEVVERRLLKGVKVEDREGLPGLTGAGLRLVGDADDYHWHASIEAPHGAYGSLGLSAQLMFYRAAEPPRHGPDIALIEEHIEAGCDLVRNHLRTFAAKLVK